MTGAGAPTRELGDIASSRAACRNWDGRRVPHSRSLLGRPADAMAFGWKPMALIAILEMQAFG